MSVQAALERNKHTMFISFFETMQQCENDRDLKYEDIQERYSWNTDEQMWTECQKVTGTFGHMVSISPSLGDLFYMWLVLKHKAGPTSFEDLHTVDGELYPDFKGVCIALGLWEDDSQWIEAMAETVQISHPLCHPRIVLQHPSELQPDISKNNF
jgi:hypothetical protein